MADVRIQTHYILAPAAPPGTPYSQGQYIRIIGDGSAIRAELWDAPDGGNYIATPSGGPDLTDPGYTFGLGGFLDPQYCSGEDLVYYTPKNDWPYADYHISVDHPSCAILVCDLNIDSFTVVNESTVGAADGQIALVSSTTHGPEKYSFDPDFDYALGQDSPLTGLSTGNYVVFTKDAAGCTDQLNVFVGIDFTYGVRWRLEYDHILKHGYMGGLELDAELDAELSDITAVRFQTRLDIEQRDYVGEIEEVCGGDTPFLLELVPDEDTQVVTSTATIQLLVERNEEGKFDEIRVGDDRQHIVKKYIDTGSGWELEFSGFISPEFYEEPYIFEPYVISLKALDGLGELKNKIFVQESGEDYFGKMSVIKIIAECLKKLPILLEIRSCINIFEENMTTNPEDDPLAQTFIKSENFRGKTCDEVITSLLKPFAGAELFQSLGVWWIRTREQSVDTIMTYRVFDENGDYVDESSKACRISLGFPRDSSRMCWIEQSQLLRYSRPYGKVTITHDLDKDNNMIDSGGFELEDIDPSTEFFRDWSLFPVQALISSGMENVDNGNSKGAFFFQWTQGASDPQGLNSIVSNAMPISIGTDVGTGNIFENSQTSFKLKFQVYVSPIFKVSWIWAGWRLRFTDVDSGDFWDWYPQSGSPISATPTVNEERINDLYITEYNSWKTYEFYNFRFPGPPEVENYTVQLSFFFHNHYGRDFDTYAALRTVVTETGTGPSMEGKRYYLAIDDHTNGYELQHNTEAESEPNIIRPNDYNLIGNPFQWVKIIEHNPTGDSALLDKILFDNVSISILAITPNLDGPGVFHIDPPSVATYDETLTARNESSLNIEVKNGDAPPLVGTEYIYNGYYTLEDDSITKLWGRVSVPGESEKLLAIYLGYLSEQGALSKRLLSGSGITNIQIGYIHSLVDRLDERKYRFIRYTLDDKRGRYDFELEETLVGADGESPPEVGAFSSGFNEGYLI